MRAAFVWLLVLVVVGALAYSVGRAWIGWFV